MLVAHARINVAISFSVATEAISEKAIFTNTFVCQSLFYVLASSMSSAVVQGIASHHPLSTFGDAISYITGFTRTIVRLVNFIEGTLRIFDTGSPTA